jgi:hypothetical protein
MAAEHPRTRGLVTMPGVTFHLLRSRPSPRLPSSLRPLQLTLLLSLFLPGALSASPTPTTGAAGASPLSSTPSLPGTGATGKASFLLLTLDAEGGHDNDILADPEGLGSLEPVSASLLTLNPVLRVGRTGLLSRPYGDRLEAMAAGGLTRYSKSSVGPDTDLRGGLSYRTDLTGRLFLEGNASMVRFRRRNLPVFSLDLPEAALRLVGTVGSRWLLAGEFEAARPYYPGRALEGGGHQSDRRFDFGGSLARSFGVWNDVALRAAWRHTGSNDPLAAHRGPLLEARCSYGSPSHLRCGVSLAFNQRDYPDYPVLQIAGPDTIDTGARRRDRTWQAAVSVERGLSDRLRIFAAGTWVSQKSRIGALTFAESRITAGVHLQLVRRGTEHPPVLRIRLAQASSDSLAPVLLSSGVRFRVRAPGARQVALVGGFNAWDSARDLLRGPDAAGIWEVTLALPPGTWRYAFVVDGKWERPDQAPRYEQDGFGAEIGILDLPLSSGSTGGP